MFCILSGVYLSLKGVNIPNDYVLANDITEGGTIGVVGDGGLLCITDRSDCCRSSGQGHWYFPDPPGDQVLIRGQRTIGNYFYRDRDAGIVRLNRVGVPTDRGLFRCEIPNAAGVNVTLYVNIGE